MELNALTQPLSGKPVLREVLLDSFHIRVRFVHIIGRDNIVHFGIKAIDPFVQVEPIPALEFSEYGNQSVLLCE